MKFVKRLFALSLLAALGALAFYMLRDLTPPTVVLTPDSGPLSPRHALQLQLKDSGSGLMSLKLSTVQGGKTTDLLSKDYPAGTHQVTEKIDLAGAGLSDGPLKLLVHAVDRGHIHFGSGNVTDSSFSFEIDSIPPQVTVLTAHHNLNQGGSGLAVFTVSEPVSKAGMEVGDLFFPAYRQPSGRYVCLFAFPWNLPAKNFVPRVVAVDQAGNQGEAGIYYHTISKKFPSDRIRVNQSFLEHKIVPTFQQFFPQVTDPLQLYVKVNRDLRRQNIQAIRDYGQHSAATALWHGAFLRMPHAASPGSFAQPRTYYYRGKVIDHETHLGLDLASTIHAPILAANAGKVIHAGDLGIYGNCVIIDHGLGVQTLYGHMSQLAVKVGDTVTKGQVIGHSGNTGLAAGDHLHFDVLVSGLQVNPVEWFDGHWLKDNVTAKLALAEKTK